MWRGKTKTKQKNFSAHCLSLMSFCSHSPGTEGLCLTTAQMAWERSTWPGWRNALERHLGDCTSSPLMGNWSWSRGTTPPSSSSWKRCVSGLRKPLYGRIGFLSLLFLGCWEKNSRQGGSWKCECSWDLWDLKNLRELKAIVAHTSRSYWVTPKVFGYLVYQWRY